MSHLLSVRGVTCRFGGHTALNDVGFDLQAGTITGVLGPNGAGKTTLFNVISGFLPPAAGTVQFDGQGITGLRPDQVVNRGLARTFQLPRPFTGMTALENVEIGCLGARARRRSSRPPIAEAAALMEQVGLADRRDLQVELLSYGDLRRLDIARAIASRPELLLLDEPLAGLGPSETEPLLALLQQLNRTEALAILIIEHKLSEFMRLVSRIVALDFGRLIADGTPEQIVRDPKVIEAYFGADDAAPAGEMADA